MHPLNFSSEVMSLTSMSWKNEGSLRDSSSGYVVLFNALAPGLPLRAFYK